MKPRLRAKIDGTYFNVESMHLAKSGWRDPSSLVVSITNSKLRYSDAFASYDPVKIEVEYKDELIKGMKEWRQVFSGYVDNLEEYVRDKSLLIFECRCRLRTLQDDDITRKWEKAYLHEVITDLVADRFKLKLDVPNFYIGDHLMEMKSRLGEINDLAELFGCITYLNGDEFYFGEYRKGKRWVYQLLNNYPREKELRNANLIGYNIRRMLGGFAYHRVVVKKVNEEKTVYRGEATSKIRKIAGKGKTLDIDHKYLTSDDMADRLAQFILWKHERLYISASLTTYGIPFIEPEWIVDVANIGEKNSGLYWVTSATTTYQNDRFETAIEANTRDPKERFVK